MLRKLRFRWLNSQIASLPMASRSTPSSRLWLSMLRMRSCCTHPDSGERASFSTPQPRRVIREARLWCARNMKDAGLSASCQLGNYPASLPGAAEPAKPAWPSSAQKLCRWWSWLIPRNAGLSSCSSVNDFIQQGEVTRGLVIKGLHFTVKTACLCAALQKKKELLQEGRGWKRGKHPSVFGCSAAVLKLEASTRYFLPLLPFLLLPVSHCRRNRNWQANELLAHTVATDRTISRIGALRCH